MSNTPRSPCWKRISSLEAFASTTQLLHSGTFHPTTGAWSGGGPGARLLPPYGQKPLLLRCLSVLFRSFPDAVLDAAWDDKKPHPAPSSRMWAQRLLMLLPSYPERSSNRWWVAQDMVSVTRTGLRLATSEGDTAAVAGAATGLENEYISSITVGLVTRSAVGAARPHQNATANQRLRPAACSGLAAADCPHRKKAEWNVGPNGLNIERPT